MKYLDRGDYLEIGIITLIVAVVLLIVTLIVLATYYVVHTTPTGCAHYVTL